MRGFRLSIASKSVKLGRLHTLNRSNLPEPCENRVNDDGTADVDISLLEDSLAMTPWKRMQANDDAVNFADGLRAAMQDRHAKPD